MDRKNTEDKKTSCDATRTFTKEGKKCPFMFSLSWIMTQTTTHAFPWQLVFSWDTSISQHIQKPVLESRWGLLAPLWLRFKVLGYRW